MLRWLCPFKPYMNLLVRCAHSLVNKLGLWFKQEKKLREEPDLASFNYRIINERVLSTLREKSQYERPDPARPDPHDAFEMLITSQPYVRSTSGLRHQVAPSLKTRI